MSQRGQGQTIIGTRAASQAHLASAVASLIPADELKRARVKAAQQLQRSKGKGGAIRTSFCPICLGPKYPRSTRCRDCFQRYRKAATAKAVEAGNLRRGTKRSGMAAGSRNNLAEQLTAEAKVRADPGRTDDGWHRRRGDGVIRTQPPLRRKVLTSAGWVDAPDEEATDEE